MSGKNIIKNHHIHTTQKACICICIMDLYYGYVLCICIINMYYVYVLCICIMYMYYVYVLCICIMYMYSVYVFCICTMYYVYVKIKNNNNPRVLGARGVWKGQIQQRRQHTQGGEKRRPTT